MTKVMLLALAGALAGCAGAQKSRPDPTEPTAVAPAVAYQSAFESYQPFAEQEPGDWRKANQAVGEAGGHKGHK